MTTRDLLIEYHIENATERVSKCCKSSILGKSITRDSSEIEYTCSHCTKTFGYEGTLAKRRYNADKEKYEDLNMVTGLYE